MFDLIIIGAGPAGISAGLYAKRANLNVLILYHGESTLEKSVKIDNYYGFPSGIVGKDLYNNGIIQAQNLGIEVQKCEVIHIEKLDNVFSVKTTDNTFNSQSLILATGNKKIKPDIPGIKEFEGKGISYCAICDAFFYKNKNVVVIGNGKFAQNEAEILSNVASNITILSNGLDAPSCNFNVNTKKIVRISGDTFANLIEFEDGTSVHADGIFIALGEAGASDFAKTLGIIQNDDNIKVNNQMETNISGIFACGDITGGLLQICTAVYEGAKAGLSAVNYIKNLKKEI